MKKIIETPNQVLQGLKDSLTSSTRSQPKISQKTDLPIHWVTEIFKVLQARYLSKWSSQVEGIEDRAVTEWARGLSGLSGEQVKQGIDDWVSNWPPSLPEFYNVCVGIKGDKKDEWQHKTLAYVPRNRLKALPKPRNKELAKTEMEKIRKLLNS